MKTCNFLNEVSNFIGLIFITLVKLPFVAAFFLFNHTAVIIALVIIITNFMVILWIGDERINSVDKKEQNSYYKHVLLLLLTTLGVLILTWLFPQLPKPTKQLDIIFYNFSFAAVMFFKWMPMMLAIYACLPTVELVLDKKENP